MSGVLGYRNQRPRGNFGNRRSNGPKKAYLNNWKPGIQAEWVWFRPGLYGSCEKCGRLVLADQPNNGYKCRNLVYENNQPKVNNNYPVRCEHVGNLESTLPYASNYNSFIKGGGKNGRGAVVPSNSFNGTFPDVPDLLWHYAQENEDLKISQHFAHMVVLDGTFHPIERESGAGNKYTTDEYCSGRGCEHCSSNIPTVQGSMKVYNPGWKHWNNLVSFSENIAECCVSCRDGYIVPNLYLCPKCGDAIHDMTDSSIDERLAVFRNMCQEMSSKDGDGFIGCPHCSERIVPIENAECMKLEFDRRQEFVMTSIPGCEVPVRMTIFDCAVKIGKTSEENTADLKLEQFDKTSFLSDEALERFPMNDFLDLTDVTPARQAELMNRPNVFYETKPRGATGGPAGSGSGNTRRGGAVNYGR
jgi:DNA-directed RNA polymerase subunit RPC12/RpoP